MVVSLCLGRRLPSALRSPRYSRSVRLTLALTCCDYPLDTLPTKKFMGFFDHAYQPTDRNLVAALYSAEVFHAQ